MLHAQALVLTKRPSRHAARLAADLGLEFPTEWSAEAGMVELPDGIVDMHSWPEGLRLDAFARTRESLARVEDVVTRQLGRETDGESLRVEWYRRPSSA
jgi:hypothetical protein